MGDYEDLANQLISEYEDNIEEANDKIFDYSQTNCPVLSGDLKRSAKKYKIKNGWAVSYNKDYAIYVHERPEGRGYKFLERASSEHEPEIEKIIRGD